MGHPTSLAGEFDQRLLTAGTTRLVDSDEKVACKTAVGPVLVQHIHKLTLGG